VDHQHIDPAAEADRTVAVVAGSLADLQQADSPWAAVAAGEGSLARPC
jgi:hypothetical protein